MQQPTEKPKWLFKLGKAISTVYCRNSQKQINVANGYKIAVGQQYFILL